MGFSLAAAVLRAVRPVRLGEADRGSNVSTVRAAYMECSMNSFVGLYLRTNLFDLCARSENLASGSVKAQKLDPVHAFRDLKGAA